MLDQSLRNHGSMLCLESNQFRIGAAKTNSQYIPATSNREEQINKKKHTHMRRTNCAIATTNTSAVCPEEDCVSDGAR